MENFRLAEKPYQAIQGEGKWVGLPMIFVRLMDCNVGCKWCDSYYTWGKYTPPSYTESIHTITITNEELDMNIRLAGDALRVWFTGGEPMLQKEAIKEYLSREGVNADRIFHICTAGTIYDEELARLISQITVDVKAPSSGTKSDNNVLSELSRLHGKVEFKMVVANTPMDLLFAKELVAKYPHIPITFQPMYNSELAILGGAKIDELVNWTYEKFAQWINITFARDNNVRMGIQLHKIISPDKARGI